MSSITDKLNEVINKGVGIIVFPASNKGIASSAFENSVYRNYKSVKSNYLQAKKLDGDIIATRVGPRLIFVPMICLQGEFSDTNQHPLSLHHLENCLMSVRELSINVDIPVYIPQFYASPKKDRWEKIKRIINKVSSRFTIWELDKTLVIN